MSGVFQSQYLTSAVVVADHAREPNDCACGLVGYQVLVFGQQDRLVSQRGAQYQRHREWPLSASWSSAWSSTSASTPSPSRTPPGEPGRLTTRVRPATPHTPRESTEAGTFGRPAHRIASASPGIS